MLAANAAIEANRIHFHPSSERLMCRPSATTSRSLSGSSLKHREVLEQRRDRQRVEPQRRTSGSCPHADTCAPVPSNRTCRSKRRQDRKEHVHCCTNHGAMLPPGPDSEAPSAPCADAAPGVRFRGMDANGEEGGVGTGVAKEEGQQP